MLDILIKAFVDLLSSGAKDHHVYNGKSGIYLKKGSDKSGRKGKTIFFKSKKRD